MIKKRLYNLPDDIINSHPRVYPRYLISPFNTEYLRINHKIYIRDRKLGLKDSSLDLYFTDAKNFSYVTKRGQEGISMVLKHLKLKKHEDVCIFNTSGSPYISSSVTTEIEKICKWGRSIGEKTKCIFIIHEFGFSANVPEHILNSGIPIIEDCAYCLGSQNEKRNLGMIGDYAIYSFSKMFPLPYGGLVRSKNKLTVLSAISPYSRNYLLTLLHHYFKKQKGFVRKKRENYIKFTELFAKHGIQPRFELNKNNIPACFIFQLPHTPLSDKLKVELNNKGIESTVYYGGDGFFIPSHQNLKGEDIEYIYRNISQVLMLKNK
jgi:hypothetical protein